MLAGFFVITEHQYGFGDVIRLTIPGTGEPIQGTVVDVSLRVTQMRTVNGEVVITPNGQIVQATNLSRDWARAVIDVPGADHRRRQHRDGDPAARRHRGLRGRPSCDRCCSTQPPVMGVESIEVDQLNIRVVARTLPGKQFDVGRELRARIADALRNEGIIVAPTVDLEAPSGQQ